MLIISPLPCACAKTMPTNSGGIAPSAFDDASVNSSIAGEIYFMFLPVFSEIYSATSL